MQLHSEVEKELSFTDPVNPCPCDEVSVLGFCIEVPYGAVAFAREVYRDRDAVSVLKADNVLTLSGCFHLADVACAELACAFEYVDKLADELVIYFHGVMPAFR